jgi:Arc/MetJ-type ribon-helix-helix transcriptional regulator
MQKRLVFRLPDKMHTKIGKAIKEGRAKNYSELIRTALEDYLKNT